MDKKDKFKLLDDGAKVGMRDDNNQPKSMSGMVEKMRADMDQHIMYTKLAAKLTRVKYEALVSEGFSAAEALEMCKGK